MARTYDVIVVGGGHAGAEAAWMASKLGAATALITMHYDAIGRMSCNPAIGGLGKGQMVREVDALGGLMGLAIDRAGIQFRILNRSKGPAVWAPRAQADRDAYPKAVQSLLDLAKSMTIIEGTVERIGTRSDPGELKRRRVHSVTLQDGRVLRTRSLILTTGTFLRGLMHCGQAQRDGGRVGEAASVGLSGALLGLGFELRRLKTGTPPRVHRDSIDYSACEVQPGDEIPQPFSFITDHLPQRQISCWITWTNERVHELIRRNLHRAPMYSGQIVSTGPRYCPSIEDKVVRFAEKDRHQIFLEPEGYDNERVYCNGISTSLPEDVQDAAVRDVPGLHDARIMQYGYAVEYDYVPTHQIRSTLESKSVDGLFFAGQINGTSGYEEAAGQGLVAGINAVQSLRREESFVLRRDEAYIGVMIDDLIARPPSEPYRMFTSRAEYRLRLRSDNADQRLTPIGRALGTVDEMRWRQVERRRAALRAIETLCAGAAHNGTTLRAWMRDSRADLAGFADALGRLGGGPFCSSDLWQALTEAKYEGYIDRQERQIVRFRKLESLLLPSSIDYASMPSLRYEAREHLVRVSPRTLGQASRLSGVSPADVTALWVYLKARPAADSAV